jgi:SAM-dependent methyltransferase
MSDNELNYYGFTRSEIDPLLPSAAPARILEIGAAAGGTLRWLRKRWPASEIVAIEGFADMAPVLDEVCDKVIIHDLEQPLPDIGKFDLILALDVLEHLRDPWAVGRQLAERLTPAGALIVSLPNVTHYTVVRPMTLRGRFEYTDAGFLDRTHLRFFDHVAAIDLVKSAGLVVSDRLLRMGFRNRFLNRATLGLFPHLFVTHHIIKGQLTGKPAGKPRID